MENDDDDVYNSPHCDTTTATLGRLFAPTGTFSILRTINKLSPTTLPENDFFIYFFINKYSFNMDDVVKIYLV